MHKLLGKSLPSVCHAKAASWRMIPLGWTKASQQHRVPICSVIFSGVAVSGKSECGLKEGERACEAVSVSKSE